MKNNKQFVDARVINNITRAMGLNAATHCDIAKYNERGKNPLEVIVTLSLAMTVLFFVAPFVVNYSYIAPALISCMFFAIIFGCLTSMAFRAYRDLEKLWQDIVEEVNSFKKSLDIPIEEQPTIEVMASVAKYQLELKAQKLLKLSEQYQVNIVKCAEARKKGNNDEIGDLEITIIYLQESMGIIRCDFKEFFDKYKKILGTYLDDGRGYGFMLNNPQKQ